MIYFKNNQESGLMFMINLMYAAILVMFSFITQGCGKDQVETVRSEIQTVQVPAPVKNEIDEIVRVKNEYRLSQGQPPLTPGLVCTLHNLQATTPSSIPSSPPSAVATFGYVGEFNQPNTPASNGLNVLPLALRPLYVQWFMIRCTGFIVVLDQGYNLFNLTSDDGSMLYINNSLVVNNDGNHGVQLRQGQKSLEKGLHSIRLDYLQGPGGNQALILENQSGIISSSLFYR